MASSTIHRQNILNLRNANTRLDHANIPTSRSSRDDEVEDALDFKRRRFSHEPSSHMQQSIQRSCSWTVEEEEQDIDESIPIEEDTHSDSTGLDEYDSTTQRLIVYANLFGACKVAERAVREKTSTNYALGGYNDLKNRVMTCLQSNQTISDLSRVVIWMDSGVILCENGHIACSSCCTKMKRSGCPVCKKKIGSKNNKCRGLEKFIKSISRISCKNAMYGCKKLVPYSKKSEHEQMCPHAPCKCPYPSCYFSGSSKNLYHHIQIQHAASTTSFTYNTEFAIDVGIDQKQIFLQELYKNVIFILIHEVQNHGRDVTVNCVGVGTLKNSFAYRLAAKSMDTKSMDSTLTLEYVREVYTEWSKLTPKLTVPLEYADNDGLLSLFVCIEKRISSEFEEEAEEGDGEVLGNDDDDDNPLGTLEVVLTDPKVLDCSICLEPLSTPIYQCQKGHLACSSCWPETKGICLLGKSNELFKRCRGLENVIETVRISCKNAEYGCKETMPYNKMSEHEQVCPHATCFCPHSSCPFTGRSKNLYSHFAIQHATSTTRFTYNTTFSLCVGRYQKYIFLQEQHENVIFVLNHQVRKHGRVFNVDCVGTSALNGYFAYQLTAKSKNTSRTLKSKPKIFTKWSEHTTRKNCLTVPSVFPGYTGLVSLSVCIKKGKI
ncbi:Aminotransferase-like mobile domain-containing protein [Artemisia annua]|uniref:RING-type E3 ubiquitin transferase n=1 Tax=Artemisia annua TaxID=35608 RepID=A0A2U1P8B8_ARTAN|nr:Aminotransferase-like mobile domain-containing protein [Artemisia annua]